MSEVPFVLEPPFKWLGDTVTWVGKDGLVIASANHSRNSCPVSDGRLKWIKSVEDIMTLVLTVCTSMIPWDNSESFCAFTQDSRFRFCFHSVNAVHIRFVRGSRNIRG